MLKEITNGLRVESARALFFHHPEVPQPDIVDLYKENPVIEAFLTEEHTIMLNRIVVELTEIMLHHPEIPVKTTRSINSGSPVPSTLDEMLIDHQGKQKTKMRVYPVDDENRGNMLFNRASYILQGSNYTLIMAQMSSSFILPTPPELLRDRDLLTAVLNITTAIRLRGITGLEIPEDPFFSLDEHVS